MKNHVTIIPVDQLIQVDNQALTFNFPRPENIHAIQWHNGAGEIEFSNGQLNQALQGQEDYNQQVKPFVDLWEEETERLQAEAKRPPTLAEKQAMITSEVQAHLDAFAQTRGYDNILSAASYVTSTNPAFAVEGRYAVEVRDLTWAKCYQILNDFITGIRPEPTLDEIMSELPALMWPEV